MSAVCDWSKFIVTPDVASAQLALITACVLLDPCMVSHPDQFMGTETLLSINGSYWSNISHFHFLIYLFGPYLANHRLVGGIQGHYYVGSCVCLYYYYGAIVPIQPRWSAPSSNHQPNPNLHYTKFSVGCIASAKDGLVVWRGPGKSQGRSPPPPPPPFPNAVYGQEWIPCEATWHNGTGGWQVW